MGFLGKLVKGVIDVALLPVDVATDVLTGGGLMTEQEKPYTVQRVEKVVKDLEEAGEQAGEGDWL